MSLDVQNESEVKEYLDKLGIEYRFGCFSEKKPEGTYIIHSYNFNKEHYILF